MFGNLKPQPADKILQLIGQFRADPRSDKIDLGVGVYKDATGLTPVMRAVKTAERQLWETERTKAYTGLAGEPEYNAALADLVLGGTVAADRISSVATPGGTGACRQAFELIRMASPEATVWVSDPTWPNHLSILNYLGMKMRPYRYFDGESRGVDFTAMMADLAGVKAGDVVLLHGCCHNPTGANLTLPEWQAVADHLERTGAVPMIDIAYQGFGDGLDADAEGVRLVAGRLPVQRRRGVPVQRRLRDLPRTHRGAHCAVRSRAARGHAGVARVSQPPELFLPARPRRAACHDDPHRPRTPRRLAGRA